MRAACRVPRGKGRVYSCFWAKCALIIENEIRKKRPFITEVTKTDMERGCRGYGNAVLPQISPVPAITRVVCKGAKQSFRTKDREGITPAGRGSVDGIQIQKARRALPSARDPRSSLREKVCEQAQQAQGVIQSTHQGVGIFMPSHSLHV